VLQLSASMSPEGNHGPKPSPGNAELKPLLDSLMKLCLAVAGAQRGAVVLARENALVVHAVGSVRQPTTFEPSPLALSTQAPPMLIERVFRTGQALVLGDAAGEDGFASDPYVSQHGLKSALAAPLRQGKETVGVLYVENDLVRCAFSAEWVRMLELSSAFVLQKSELPVVREPAESARQFLAEACATLAESLDYGTTLAEVARISVPFLADACLVDVITCAGKFRRVAEAHADPAKEPMLRALRARRRDVDIPQSVASTLRPGESQLFPELSDALLAQLGLDDYEIDLMHKLELRTAMVVPLTVRGRTLGTVVFGAEALGRYGRAEFALAQELARHAALSIDNARLYRESQAAIRIRDEFLVAASHELQTPLTPLQLVLQNVERALSRRDLPELSQQLNTSLRQVDRLTVLVRDLLDCARINSGCFRLDHERVDLAEIVRTVTARYRERLFRSGCVLQLDAPAQVVGCWDRHRVEQLVSVLLSNAIKFGPKHPVVVQVTRAGILARLSVRDFGIGIPPEDRHRVFEPFQRAASADYGGLGLGLHMARYIAAAHSGSIRIESEPNAGATFIVELPFEPIDDITEV
jgi:signal transduction histidine kinase